MKLHERALPLFAFDCIEVNAPDIEHTIAPRNEINNSAVRRPPGLVIPIATFRNAREGAAKPV